MIIEIGKNKMQNSEIITKIKARCKEVYKANNAWRFISWWYEDGWNDEIHQILSKEGYKITIFENSTNLWIEFEPKHMS